MTNKELNRLVEAAGRGIRATFSKKAIQEWLGKDADKVTDVELLRRTIQAAQFGEKANDKMDK